MHPYDWYFIHPYMYYSDYIPKNQQNHIHDLETYHPDWNPYKPKQRIDLRDHGKRPYVVNIDQAAKQNENYRTAIWTGTHLQVTVMSIDVGDDIGLEVHPDVDQFIRIEKGKGIVQMGNRKDRLNFRKKVYQDDAIMVPAGTWHNVTNIGNRPLKLYTIYAPPEHPFGTVHKTKADAMHT